MKSDINGNIQDFINVHSDKCHTAHFSLINSHFRKCYFPKIDSNWKRWLIIDMQIYRSLRSRHQNRILL